MKISYNSSYSLKQNTSTLDVMTGDQYRNYVNEVYAGTDRLANIQSMMGTANTDWQDLIYRTAFSTDQNVSLYGSVKEKLPYRVSLGYTYDEATLKVGDNQRANMSISLTPKFFQDHLSVNLNAKGIYNRANYPNSELLVTLLVLPRLLLLKWKMAAISIGMHLMVLLLQWQVLILCRRYMILTM